MGGREHASPLNCVQAGSEYVTDPRVAQKNARCAEQGVRRAQGAWPGVRRARGAWPGVQRARGAAGPERPGVPCARGAGTGRRGVRGRVARSRGVRLGLGGQGCGMRVRGARGQGEACARRVSRGEACTGCGVRGVRLGLTARQIVPRGRSERGSPNPRSSDRVQGAASGVYTIHARPGPERSERGAPNTRCSDRVQSAAVNPTSSSCAQGAQLFC